MIVTDVQDNIHSLHMYFVQAIDFLLDSALVLAAALGTAVTGQQQRAAAFGPEGQVEGCNPRQR